jgi:hypothetical protein
MHGLIALYLGFFIYLIFYFRFKKKNALAKKITIFLAIKLLFLTILYLIFFSDKMTKEQRQKNIETIITH